MISGIARLAIKTAAWITPKSVRKSWREEWLAEASHHGDRLRERGLSGREMRARMRHHCAGAFTEAWQLRTKGWLPALQSAAGNPRTVPVILAVLLIGIVASSRGLQQTRSMIVPEHQDADRLVLVYESGILMGERLAVPPALLEYWKANNTTFDGLAGYRWDPKTTGWYTADFFQVLGNRPSRFLLRDIRDWKPLADNNAFRLGVVGRLKQGVDSATADEELRRLANNFRKMRGEFRLAEAQTISLTSRVQQPLFHYLAIGLATSGILLVFAAVGIVANLRRSGRIAARYWAHFGIKAFGLPLVLVLATWEFSFATNISLTGGTTFRTGLVCPWMFIVACGGILWWCLADQQARCRGCLQLLQLPVRVGSVGAILFDHAGTEFVCREGHGALYVPDVCSSYVQSEEWMTMGCGKDATP